MGPTKSRKNVRKREIPRHTLVFIDLVFDLLIS